MSSYYIRFDLNYPMDLDISALIDGLQDQIPKWLDEHKINGFSVALTGKTGILWSNGFGYADHEKNLVSSQTLFMIGSLSKAYTVAAFLRAVQSGLVALDDRLIDHYPEFNWRTRYGESQRESITFRHLLTHWAGLQHNANLRLPEGGYCSFNEYMRRVNEMWQKYPVGARFSYSNIGFDLVAAALQRITGQSLEAWMCEQVYKPLGMTRSTTVASEALNREDVALGHFGGSEFSFKDMVIPLIASGAQYSSVDDMSRYVAMHLNRGVVNGERFLDESLLDEVYRIPYQDEYQLMAIGMGIGVSRFKYGGELFLYFFGDGPGYLSLHQLFPRLGVGWVMSCNQSVNARQLLSSVAQKIEDYIVKAKLGEVPADLNVSSLITPRRPVHLDVGTLDRLSGRYVSRMVNIEVKHLDGALIFQWQDEPNHLTPLSATEFTSKTTPLVRFNLNESGRPLTMKMLPTNGYTTVLDYDGGKCDPHGPDKPEWSKHLGYYRYDYGVFCWYYAVRVLDGYLFLVTSRDGFRLHEYEPRLFFTSDGQNVEFTRDSVILPDGVYIKEDLSAESIQRLMDSCPGDIRLHESSLSNLMEILEKTGRADEACKIREIIEASSS